MQERRFVQVLGTAKRSINETKFRVLAPTVLEQCLNICPKNGVFGVKSVAILFLTNF